ncbi:hypothetical protein N0B31_02705 [Salinirubellus salinus]|uniref:Uncharacterized protein n=1 Tax=Salinirubellus salinus TaxID=1364945 RepID=A0A9E7U8U6_9EURY|nr:hypothetical protein [Salinirubellus salinus]UWM55201.1 hypothetical protein N0B31_02705 [Salinirubellus salinus]
MRVIRIPMEEVLLLVGLLGAALAYDSYHESRRTNRNVRELRMDLVDAEVIDGPEPVAALEDVHEQGDDGEDGE